MSDHWLQFVAAYVIVIVVLSIVAAMQEYLTWRKERK